VLIFWLFLVSVLAFGPTACRKAAPAGAVDFYLEDTRESGFQLFADGSPEGWFAYLQTPKGFVEYPGSFAIGGSKLVFTAPWSSLDWPKGKFFNSFADWSRRGDVVNTSAQDNAPSIGKTGFPR